MSGHKPGTDHAENPENIENTENTENLENPGFSGTDGLTASSTGTTSSTSGPGPEASPGGRSRIGIAAVTGALLLGGSVTAYDVTSQDGSAHRHSTAQAVDLAAQAAADTSAARQEATDQAADSPAIQIAAQHQAQAAGAKAAAQAAAKAAADRAAAAAKANRDAQRKALPTAPAKAKNPAPGRSSGSSAAYGSAQAIAKQLVPASQYQCFATIIQRESGWNIHARNPSSGAYGLGQALPGSKMASAGPDWQNNPTTQIKWVLSYMDHRYGSPCAALSFWNSHGWY